MRKRLRDFCRRLILRIADIKYSDHQIHERNLAATPCADKLFSRLLIKVERFRIRLFVLLTRFLDNSSRRQQLAYLFGAGRSVKSRQIAGKEVAALMSFDSPCRDKHIKLILRFSMPPLN